MLSQKNMQFFIVASLLIFLSICACFTFVQWQSVKVRRQSVVAQAAQPGTLLNGMFQTLVAAGFSIEETLDYLYSAPYPAKKHEEKIKQRLK